MSTKERLFGVVQFVAVSSLIFGAGGVNCAGPRRPCPESAARLSNAVDARAASRSPFDAAVWYRDLGSLRAEGVDVGCAVEHLLSAPVPHPDPVRDQYLRAARVWRSQEP